MSGNPKTTNLTAKSVGRSSEEAEMQAQLLGEKEGVG